MLYGIFSTFARAALFGLSTLVILKVLLLTAKTIMAWWAVASA